MKNTVALITGATSGIGRETALLFAHHGVKIAANGRNEKAGKDLITEIRDLGVDAIFIKADIADPKSASSMVSETFNHFGRLDYAINNAGIEGMLAPVAETIEEDWDAVMNLNLKGLWLCMKYELAVMIQNGGGKIVNISTNLTRFSNANTGVYTASKAGVEALGRIAAVENGKYGIRINTVNPGAVDTPMLHRILSDEALAQFIKENPLRKIATPNDVAQAIFWLCSPPSNHVNGTSITVDGGG